MGTTVQKVKDLNGLEGFLCNCDGRAGLSCENAPEVFCVKGEGAPSTNSFCVNGGRCISVESTVTPGVMVAGCSCTDDFEGPNCQYPKGTVPNSNATTDEDEDTSPTPGAPVAGIRATDDGGGLSTGAIVGISVGAFVLTICLACIVKQVFSKDNDPPSVVVGDEQGGEQGF